MRTASAGPSSRRKPLRLSAAPSCWSPARSTSRHGGPKGDGSPRSTLWRATWNSTARHTPCTISAPIGLYKSSVPSWLKSTTRERGTMARQKTAERKPAVEPAEQYVPSWQQDSVDRSLRNAIERARKRSDRFVEAAVELLSERDESDFSIQDVVDRSGQSQRTFYTFFDSKDSLMLAVYETILRKTAMPMLQERCEGIDDPVLRLRTLLDALSEITEMPARLARGLSVLHLRLAETRPNDLAGAVEPLHAFIVELLTAVASAGRLREDLPLDTQAALLQELLLAATHSRVLTGGSQTSVDDLWAFCSAAILRRGD